MKPRSTAVHTYFPVMIFVCWSVFLVWMLQGYRYRAFLIPAFSWLLLFSVFMCGWIALAFRMNRDRHVHGQEFTSLQVIVRGIILLIPILFALAVQDQSLGIDAIKKRRVGSGSADAGIVESPLKILDIMQSDDIKFEPIPYITFRLNWDKQRHTTLWDKMEGNAVSAEGLFMDAEDSPEGYIQIFRFLVTCCAADARPVEAYIKCSDCSMLKDGDWVKVEGFFRTFKVGKRMKPFVDAQRITRMSPPVPGMQYIY